MKLFLILFSLPFFSAIALAQQRPTPFRYVNDEAHLLSSSELLQLEKKLNHLDHDSSNQIIILTLPLNNYCYADSILQNWNIGNSTTANGEVIVVSPTDQYIAANIAVTIGLEGILSPGYRNFIILNDINPYFSQKLYLHGLTKAVEALNNQISGKEYADAQKPTTSGVLFQLLICVVVGLIFLGSKVWTGKRMPNGAIDIHQDYDSPD